LAVCRDHHVTRPKERTDGGLFVRKNVKFFKFGPAHDSLEWSQQDLSAGRVGFQEEIMRGMLGLVIVFLVGLSWLPAQGSLKWKDLNSQILKPGIWVLS
jgi:hypothetical protein